MLLCSAILVHAMSTSPGAPTTTSSDEGAEPAPQRAVNDTESGAETVVPPSTKDTPPSVAPTAHGGPDVGHPPRAAPDSDDGLDARLISDTVTRQFERFGVIERRRRFIHGGLGVGTGLGIVGLGVSTLVVSEGTTADGSGVGSIVLGAITTVLGAGELIGKGTIQKLVSTPEFRRGATLGWSPERLKAIAKRTNRMARRAKRQRQAVGGTLIVLGGLAAVATAVFLGRELSQDDPDPVRTTTLGRSVGVSVGLLVDGILGVSIPTTVETLASQLPQ